MKFAMIPALLALPFAAAAESDAVDVALCQQLVDQVTALASQSITVAEVRTEGRACVFEGLVVDMPGTYEPDFHIARAVVAGQGFTELLAEQRPLWAVSAQIDGLRIVPQTGDPFFDYMMQVQQARNGIEFDLSITWDSLKRQVRMEQLEVDFPGENALFVRFVADNVDLSSRAALETSLTAMAVTEMDIEVTSNGLFEGYAFPALAGVLLGSAEDPEAEVQALKALALSGLAVLPDDLVDAASREALAQLVRDMPNPGGTLALRLRAEPGIGALRFAPVWLRGVPRSLAEAEPMLVGVTLDASYDRVPIE